MEKDAPKGSRICFVCTGNTCRSPMAEVVANHLAKEKKIDLVAHSAGLYAVLGDPIAENAVSVLEEAGILPAPTEDYHHHTARHLGELEASEYDRLIGMTPTHVLELTMRYPALASRISCMPQAISDPFGGDLACYRECLAQIIAGVKVLLSLEDGE